MLRLFVDHDFDQDILRGLARRIPGLDAVTAYEVGLSRSPDSEILAWAAKEARVIVTHDRRTMPDQAADCIAAGETVSGVIVVSRRLPIGLVIDDLEIIVLCSDSNEWENIARHLPL